MKRNRNNPSTTDLAATGQFTWLSTNSTTSCFKTPESRHISQTLTWRNKRIPRLSLYRWWLEGQIIMVERIWKQRIVRIRLGMCSLMRLGKIWRRRLGILRLIVGWWVRWGRYFIRWRGRSSIQRIGRCQSYRKRRVFNKFHNQKNNKWL